MKERKEQWEEGGRALLFLWIVYWQPFRRLAFNHCTCRK